MKLEFFFERFSKNSQIANFMKIRTVGAELYHDHRTDLTKPIVVYRNFVNAPEKRLVIA